MASTSRHFSSFLNLFRSVNFPFRHRQSYSSLVYSQICGSGRRWNSKTHFRNRKEKILNLKNYSRNQTTNVGNHKIILEIKRPRQELKHIIILVILLEHRT